MTSFFWHFFHFSAYFSYILLIFSLGSHSNAVRPSTSSHAIFPVSLTCEERAELQQLAQLVPVANTRVANDPCALLRAAALYIDQLRTTVAVRVRNGTLPRG